MVPLLDVDERTGGLEVVPDTNNEIGQKHLVTQYPKVIENPSDWVPMKEGDQFWGKAQLVLAKAGDLILFDSRTIHGGRVGTGEYSEEEKNGE
jgi:ectoine hydroxylase-related dioxygenase (phytanoyl-CoA dioxygenase family)